MDCAHRRDKRLAGKRRSEYGGQQSGAGLRAGKAEGRIKGKLYPPMDRVEWTTEEFASAYGVERFADEDGSEITEKLTLRFELPTKLIYQSGKVTAVLIEKDGIFMPKPKIKKNKG